MRNLHHIALSLVAVMASMFVASCGEDYKGDIDKLNDRHVSIEQRIKNLETQVSTLNTQLSQLSVLATAVEQGFYITAVKTIENGYELTLSNGHVIVLQNGPENTLTPMPAISMTQIGGFYYWTLNGQLLTGTDGQPIRSTGLVPVVRYDYTTQQWVISIDGGTTFQNVSVLASVIVNETVLMQVIDNYIHQHQTTIIRQDVLFQIVSTFIQQNYAQLFNVEILDEVVANYVSQHYTKIFSYELLEKIFNQYNFDYAKSQINVDELINVIISFIKEHKEIFLDNEVLYEIITTYIEVNKTTIFSNELLLEVIDNFIKNNENFINVDLLTQVVSNYMEEHKDVIFNTETVYKLLFEYVQKYYTQVFSQTILVQLISTYVSQNTTTIFDRTTIQEVVNNYLKNNSSTFISQETIYEIINNYVKTNGTWIIRTEVLYEVISSYFEKNYSLFIDQTVISQAINNYMEKHKTTIIDAEIISQVVNSYLQQHYAEIFSYDMLTQIVHNYFEQNQQVFYEYIGKNTGVVRSIVVDDDACLVGLSNGQTLSLVVYDAYARLRDRVQSIVVLPNADGRVDYDKQTGALELKYLVSPASMAQVIINKFWGGEVTLEVKGTYSGTYSGGNDGRDGRQPGLANQLTTLFVYEAYVDNGVLTIRPTLSQTGITLETVALHVKENKTGGTDIMTEFTPVGEGQEEQHPDTPKYYTTCPDNNHPHMIDLGLPSGTLWACCNVGVNNPKYSGTAFAWGETETKDSYSWSTYKYGSSKDKVTNIGKDISGTKYDAAYTLMGDQWCLPTRTQFQELINKCKSEWVTIDKWYEGRRFTGTNGGTIFFPAVRVTSSSDELIEIRCTYWTSTLGTQSCYAYLFYSNKDKVAVEDYYRYQIGRIRPVAKK